MTRRQEVEKELREVAREIEKHVSQISHLDETLKDAAFGMVSVDEAILDEIRVAKAEAQRSLEELRIRSYLAGEEHLHLVRGAVSGKKFGF
jgi:hypothetical protein